MLHIPPINLLPLAARREPYKKKPISFEVFWKTIVRKMGQQAEEKKDTTERVTGLGKKNKSGDSKVEQMTALRFQSGGDIRHPRPPFGDKKKESSSLKNETVNKK